MNGKELQQLAKKYLAGQATAEEKHFLESWYSQFEQKPGLHLPTDEFQQIENEIFERILQNKERAPRIMFGAARWLKVAAMWVAIIGASGLLYTKRLWLQDQVDPVKQIVRTAEKGYVVHMELSDGTKIWLNGGSRIEFPDQFRYGTRVVKLTGEAYFDVKHDAKPFIVYTGEVKTQVLGTAFNINSYTSLDNVKVSVTKGMVAVSPVKQAVAHPAAPIMVTPNQQVVYNRKTSLMTKSEFDAGNVAGWVHGSYEFRDVSLDEVSVTLENRFNIVIEMRGKKLAKRKVTASFEYADSLTDVLEAFRQTAGLRYEILPGKVIWY